MLHGHVRVNSSPSHVALSIGPIVLLLTTSSSSSISSSSCALLLDLSDDKHAQSDPPSGGEKKISTIQVDAMEFTPDGLVLVVACSTKRIYWFDVSKVNEGVHLDVPKRVMCIAFWDGSMLTADKIGDVLLYDRGNKHGGARAYAEAKTRLTAQHVSIITHMVVSGDRYLIIVEDSGKIIAHCLPNTFEIQSIILCHRGPVRCISIDPVRHEVLSFGTDGYLCYSSLTTGETLCREACADVCVAAFDVQRSVHVFGPPKFVKPGMFSHGGGLSEPIVASHGAGDEDLEDGVSGSVEIVDLVAASDNQGAAFVGLRCDGRNPLTVFHMEEDGVREEVFPVADYVEAMQTVAQSCLDDFRGHCERGITICDEMLRMVQHASGAPWKLKKQEKEGNKKQKKA